MRYLMLFVVILCPAVISFAGDKGKLKNAVTEEQRVAILTTGKWQMVDAYARYIVNGDTVKRDRWAEKPACFKDNYMILRADKVMCNDQGILKCSPAAKQVDCYSKWRIDNIDNALWLDNAEFSNGLYIEYVNDSFMQINEDKIFGDATGIRLYKHVPLSQK